MRKLFLYLSIVSVVFISCRGGIFGKRVAGDGNVRTETRTAGTFNSVDVSGAMDLYVKQESNRSIKIVADENLLPYIVVDVEGDKLVIKPKNGFNLNPTSSIKVYVSSPVFNRIEASGACDVFTENQINSSETFDLDLSGSSDAKMDIKAPKISAEVSGACSVELRGETKEFNGDGSGSSNFKCFDLKSESTVIGISGAGDAEVFASVKLDVDVTGAGEVKYKGNPSINQKISGAGSVRKAD
jgi:carbon monoxide dehydrogenase subunit G